MKHLVLKHFTWSNDYSITYISVNLRGGGGRFPDIGFIRLFQFMNDFRGTRWALTNVKIAKESWDIILSNFNFWSSPVDLLVNTSNTSGSSQVNTKGVGDIYHSIEISGKMGIWEISHSWFTNVITRQNIFSFNVHPFTMDILHCSWNKANE